MCVKQISCIMDGTRYPYNLSTSAVTKKRYRKFPLQSIIVIVDFIKYWSFLLYYHKIVCMYRKNINVQFSKI